MLHFLFAAFGVFVGLIGLFMAARAHDTGIELFGFALMAFGVLFCWWMMKTAFDEAEGTGDRSIEGS